jgi:hypothetical protein
MGSDTLAGTPGNQKAVAVAEVRQAGNPWVNSGWENNAPDLGNGVMWLMSTAYQSNQPANFAFTFFYTFINTGPAITGATMSCGVDNCGYIVLNGVKYPSTNVNMGIGYEGIVTFGSFTVNIPPGLNTLELRAVNISGTPGNNVWENEGLTGGPTAAWMTITSSTGILLIKTTDKWQCTQFNYPAKFIRPLSLGDVAENAGLSRPYSLAALAGKRIYDNSMNATTLSLPISLFTADFKTFVSPSYTSTEFNPGSNGNWYAWNARVPTGNGTYSCRAVASGNPSKFITWTCTVSGGTASVSGFSLTNVNNGGNPQIGWSPTFAINTGVINGFPYSRGGIVYFIIDFWYRFADATYILTVTKTS